MRPDRILVGEVRDGAALDLLDVWNTGHEGGVATLHANNARAGLTRLRSLITRNKAAPQPPHVRARMSDYGDPAQCYALGSCGGSCRRALH